MTNGKNGILGRLLFARRQVENGSDGRAPKGFAAPSHVHWDDFPRNHGGSLPLLTQGLWPEALAPQSESKRPAGQPKEAKKSDKRVVTVSVDGQYLRIVAFTGTDVTAWTTVDLNQGESELPAEIGHALAEPGRHVCDLPFYAPLLRYLERPEVRKRYLEEVITTEIAAAIPFELEEVDLRWRPFQNGHGPEVVATAVPCEAMDSHVELMASMGVRPAAAYAKTAALVHAVGQPNAVIAHLTATEADLVLVRDNVPRATHRMDLPSAAKAPEYAAVLLQAVRELTAYEVGPSLASPEAAGEPSPDEVPVVLTGLVPPSNRITALLRASLGDRLKAVRMPVTSPEGFPDIEYAVNVGLLVADAGAAKPSRKSGLAEQITLDLLPLRHQPKGRVSPKKAIAAGAAAALALFAVLGTGGLVQAKVSNAVYADYIADLEQHARIARLETSRVQGVQQQVTTLSNQLDAIHTQQEVFERDIAKLFERIDFVTRTRGTRVTVNNLSLNAGNVRITAQAPSYETAVQYVDMVRNSDVFTDVTLGNISRSGLIVRFDITGRYSN